MNRNPTRLWARGLAAALALAVVIVSCGGSTGTTAPGQKPFSDGGAFVKALDGASLFLDDSSAVVNFNPGNPIDSGVTVPGHRDSGAVVQVGCPIYTKMCGGACIPITVDPNNCGDCGKTCGTAEICSSGSCVPATRGCIPAPQGGDPALKVCGRACVDPLNDNKNCGTCGHACAAMQGCVNGACVTAVPLTATSPQCGQECFRDLAKTTFRWALCSCGDVSLQQKLFTDAYDSTKSPYPPTPLEVGGGVGVNGKLSGGGAQVSVGGALWCSGPGGVTTQANATVSQEAHVAGPVAASGGTLSILDSAWVGGNITGAVHVSKALTMPATATTGAGVTSASKVAQAVSVPPPCDCSATPLLGQSVAAMVAAHASSNDNATIGLSPDALATKSSTALRLDLPCGRYYLKGINQPGTSVTVFAHGQTQLFIDGDVVGATVSFVLDPTGDFDTFISGTVKTSGQFIIGSPNYPALSRTYIGGSAPIDLLGEAGRTAGNLYMGSTPLNVSSHLVLYGGVIVGSLANQENVEIHYDRAVLDVAQCAPPPPMCSTCTDCGNQACVNGACGACTTSDQCCAPLICAGGTCVVTPPPR